MNGSSGQAVIVTGVVSPQDLPFLQVSQSARPGAREFREALYVAAAQDKKFDSKQLDREPLRSAGASRADAQTSKKTLSSTETRDGTSEFSESLGIDGETHETLDSEPREESVNGKGLPTFDRQSLPLNAHLAGSRRESSFPFIPSAEKSDITTKADGLASGDAMLQQNSLARATRTKTITELTQSLRGPLGIDDLNSARMTRMSLDGSAMTSGGVTERAGQLGLNRGETLRGQLERSRFSRSMDGEVGRKINDSVLRLPKVESLVSELASSASSRIFGQSSTSPGGMQGNLGLANQDPSLAAPSAGSLSGQLSTKSLMFFAASATGTVNTKIDSSAWMEQIANRAKMAVKQGLRSVEIKLTPAHLGTIEILVAQDDESTQLAFFTKHAHIRDALESQLARLQKSFQEDGLELSDAWVSDQSLAEHREHQSASEQADEWGGGTLPEGTSSLESVNTPAHQRNRLDPDRQLDVWA